MIPRTKQSMYYDQLQEWTARFESSSDPDLLEKLAAFLSPDSFSIIEKAYSQRSPEQLLDLHDLRFLCGYFSFIDELGIPSRDVSIELRIEERSGGLEKGFLALLLVEPAVSLLQSVRLRTLLWTHSEDFVNERFFGKEQGPYLCGSYLGRSKFFAAAPGDVGLTKAEVIAALGLEGYLKVQKPGPLYVVRATMKPEDLTKQVEPKVALVYKKRKESGPWLMRDSFLRNSVPGFTSGGIAEVVGKTFQIDAADLDDLKRKGVEILVLH